MVVDDHRERNDDEADAMSSNTSSNGSSIQSKFTEEFADLETPASSQDESEASMEDICLKGSHVPRKQSKSAASPPEENRCCLLPSRPAKWVIHGKDFRLSTLAAAILLHENIIRVEDLVLHPSVHVRPDSPEPTDPISGVLIAVHSTVGGVINGLADYPIEVSKILKQGKPLHKGMADEFAITKGKGVTRIVGSGLKAPLDITMGLAKGFSNLPKVYGDETVREKESITGVESGLKAAGKGFGLGLYDGITGLVTQPVNGAKQGGVLGFAKGFGMGIGGVVCKPIAGACGLPAYAFRGVYEEVYRYYRPRGDEQVVALLEARGERELKLCDIGQREEVLRRWHASNIIWLTEEKDQ